MSDDPLLSILILVILTAINAFFAASEIAVISLSETKLRKQAEEGDKKAKKLLALMQAPDNFLSGHPNRHHLSRLSERGLCSRQLRRPPGELAGTGPGGHGHSGGRAQHADGHFSHHHPVLLHASAGRVGTEAHRNEKDRGEWPGPQWGRSGGSHGIPPGDLAVEQVHQRVLRLLHIDPKADEEEVSEDEIRMMVDLGEERGTIEANEKELIDNIFEFNNTTAEDVMVHRTDMS